MHTADDRNLYEIVSQKENIGEIPLVTVLITLYNYQNFITNCLDSVKHQSIDKLNIVIVDDFSTDRSLKIANKWLHENGKRFNEYVLARHTINRNVSHSRNTAISLVRTRYVFILDADNLLYPRCLESLVDALENCDASFAYCYLEKFGEVNCLQNTKPWNPSTLGVVNTIDAMVLLRKNVLEKVGGYSIMPSGVPYGWEDYDLWFKIARIKGWGVQVPEILARYRVHKRSKLNTETNPNVEKLWLYLKAKYPEFFI